jgi:intein/homing endonuclease
MESKFEHHLTIKPVTERFVLGEQTLSALAKLTPEFGFNGLGEVVFRRTYSRNNETWKDVVVRVIQGTMSIRKEHYTRNSLFWDEKAWQTLAHNMALALFKMEWLPPGRGLWMMGTEFTYNHGSTALNNCFSSDTKFWTDKGLKSFGEFNSGDPVVIRGRDQWLDAHVYCFGQQELINLTVASTDETNIIRTTANHRWLVQDPETKAECQVITSGLRPGDQLVMTKMRHKGNLKDMEESWSVVEISSSLQPEEVWCIQEPKHEEFTLEQGILTKNCSATDTAEDLVLSAEWTMDCLMNGVGVGFSTHWRGEATAPDKSDTEPFVIPDSREGWVQSLIKLMCAYIDSPKYGKCKFPIFDYSQIRPAGTPIHGFGGMASGPAPLEKMHGRIEGYLDAFCKGKLETTAQVHKPDEDGVWKQVEVEIKKEYTHVRLVADIFNAIGACVVAGNVRRCLPGDALVYTKEGLIPIRDIEVGCDVLTSSGYEKVLNKFEQGKQKLVRIITQDGDFKCTSNHRMAVCTSYNKYDWKEAGDLAQGDRLISTRSVVCGKQTNLPDWEYERTSTNCKDIVPPQLDSDMAWLIGLFQGDGYTYPNYKKNGFNAYVSIVFGLNEYDAAVKAKQQLERFGEDLHVRLVKRKNENSYMVHCQSKQMAWYFHQNVKQANEVIRVPEYIINSTPDIRLAFVAGLTDADGCLKSRPAIVVTTVYEALARDVQQLLYSCGMESRLHKCNDDVPSRKEGWQRLYNVILITKRSKELFAGIPELHKEMRSTSRSQNANGFPVSFETTPKVKTKYGLYANKQFNLDAYERQYGDCDYAPVEVFDIIPIDEPEEQTYDIEVENNHEFFCNGYLTHNSAEICLGHADDEIFKDLKNYEKNPERGEIGWMSNNSVILKADEDYENFEPNKR